MADQGQEDQDIQKLDNNYVKLSGLDQGGLEGPIWSNPSQSGGNPADVMLECSLREDDKK